MHAEKLWDSATARLQRLKTNAKRPSPSALSAASVTEERKDRKVAEAVLANYAT